MKIFDFHLHPGYDFHNDELGYEITPEIFIEGLKKDGVNFCSGSVIHKDIRSRPIGDYEQIVPELNKEAYAFYERYTDMYTPGIHVHPEFVELSCKEVEYYAEKGVKLVGELVPYLMGWTSYADKRLIEILRVASERKMVLSIHPMNATDMEKMIQELPDMKIVVAHLGGYGLFDWSIDMMKKYSNVYFDISAHGGSAQTVRDAVRKVGKDRILYGSDYPGYQSQPFINAVLDAGLSEEEMEAILYKNAEGLLGIKVPS